MYVALRLLFIYADSGLPPRDDGRPARLLHGPRVHLQRFLDEGHGQDLVADGITDAASFEAAVWRWQGETTLTLLVMTLGGALVPAAWRAWRPAPSAEDIEALMAASE